MRFGRKFLLCVRWCGAPLDGNAGGRGLYWGMVIRRQAQNWVISALGGIRQETV